VSVVRARPASLRDLGRIEELYRLAGPSLSEAGPPARLWTLFSQTLSALLPLTQETLLLVAEEEGRVIGFVQASARPPRINPASSPVALQVLNLCVDPDADHEEVAPALIDQLCNQALERGTLRLFVRLPIDDPLTPVFRLQGFRQYATESVLYADSPLPGPDSPPAGARPMRSRDTRLLYQLYRKVTPMGVAQVEAPTYREWRQLRDDDGQQTVIDRVELVGWVSVRKASGTSPHTLSFLTLPEEPLPGELADVALGQAGSGPAWASLRHYDSPMIDALRGRGFTTLLIQALLVRELAIRVPVEKTGLVPSFG
jgi:GNAT superfamily N-acetyltransferase